MLYFLSNAGPRDIDAALIAAANAQNLRDNYFIERYNEQTTDSQEVAILRTFYNMADVSKLGFVEYIEKHFKN